MPGVLAVHGITMGWPRFTATAKGLTLLRLVHLLANGPRFSPGEGGFFTLDDDHLSVGVEPT